MQSIISSNMHNYTFCIGYLLMKELDISLPSLSHVDRIFFTPTSNQTVPSNSLDNVTYNCEVDANRILIWEVNMIPLEDIDYVRQFEAIGVFKVDQGTNRSTLIITRDAREEYSWQPISVRCSAFTSMPLQSDHSSFSYVITQYSKWTNWLWKCVGHGQFISWMTVFCKLFVYNYHCRLITSLGQ